MGVVIRQGLKSTAVQYAGVVIGAATILFLVPLVREEYGLVQVMVAAANLLAPFAMLGSYGLAVRFYPRFTNPDAGRQGFLTLLLLLCLVGNVLFISLWPWLDGYIRNYYFAEMEPEYRQHLRYLPVLVSLFVFIKVLIQYVSNFRRIVVPTLLEQFLFKITLPTLLLLYLYGYISTGGVVWGTLGNYTFVLIGMIAYAATLKQLKFSWPSKQIFAAGREMSYFAGYGIAGMVGAILAFSLDTIMVGSYLGVAAVAQYAMASFICEIIMKPYTNLKAVVGPQVSEAWARDDRATLQRLYRKSTDNLLLICGYLFGGILVCYPGLVQLSTKSEVLAGAFTTFLILGFARLVDAATSINEHIITYSNRYQFNLIAILFLAVSNVVLNTVLVPRYGISGAALATLISVGTYNTVKVLFAGFSFKLWPFGKTTCLIAAALVLCVLAVYLLPLFHTWWVDIPLRGGLLTCLLGAYVWFGEPSAEAKGILRSAISPFKSVW